MRLGRRPAEPAAIRPSLPHLELAGPSAPRRGAGAAGPRASTAEAQERAADRSGLGADLRAAGRREADEPIQCPLRHGWLRAGPGLPGWARPGARGCRLTCSPAAGGGGVSGEAGLTRDGAGGAIAMVPAAPRAAVCPIRPKLPSEKGRGTRGMAPTRLKATSRVSLLAASRPWAPKQVASLPGRAARQLRGPVELDRPGSAHGPSPAMASANLP